MDFFIANPEIINKINSDKGNATQTPFIPKIGARIRVTVERGETWFVAQDICDILNLKNSRKAIQSLDMDEKHDVTISYTPGGNQRVKAVNESGLYHLVFISRKPEARAFRRWITSEVLPSIRRTGGYSLQSSQRQLLPSPKFRPEFIEWKEKVRHWLSRKELLEVANGLNLVYSHVRKVYSGNTMSKRVASALDRSAKDNCKKRNYYPDPVPVYEQLSIGWEEMQ